MPKPHIPLDELNLQVRGCRRCPLADGRTQTVFGTGNPHARVLFVGEAPGKNEDLQGEPFVGAAGHYLNELLGVAGLRREDVFIANVLKCRPPSNRDPRPEEIETCAPFLREQTRTIDPEVIVTLGNVPLRALTDRRTVIGNVHGTFLERGGRRIFPMYHPASVIYNPSLKEVYRADVLKLGEWLRENKK